MTRDWDHRRADVRTDAGGLRDFFRSRTVTEAVTYRMRQLIADLGSKDVEKRQNATAALLKVGRMAEPFVRKAAEIETPATRVRAGEILAKPEMGSEADRILILLRLIRERRTPGALPVLLDYFSTLTEKSIEEDLLDTIVVLGMRNGWAVRTIVDAIEDKDSRKRMAAALVLGRSPRALDRELAYGMRYDSYREVRLRAGEGLLFGGDRRGVGILIDLLTGTTLELGERAERLLAIASRRDAPSFMLSEKPERRVACQKAWRDWATKLGNKLDLKDLEMPARKQGYRLIVTNTGDGGEGAIWEYTPERVQSWFTKNVVHPVDAQVLPNGNILVTEYNACRVSERDRNGKMIWARARLKTFPHNAQLLPNGNISIVTKDGISEETRERKQVATTSVPTKGSKIYSGEKLSNGTYLVMLDSGRVMDLGRKDTLGHDFHVNAPHGLTTVEALPGGRYLIPDTGMDKVRIVDKKGRTLREYKVTEPTSATILPNGNILVGSYTQNTVVEIDCNGKRVWDLYLRGQVVRVRVR